MFKDITLGQYYPGNSIIHRLDPRVKLMGTIMLIAVLFIGNNFYLYLPITAYLAFLVIISKVPFSYIFRGIKPIIPLIIISAAFNIFMTPGNILCGWWIFNITDSGIYMALFIALRITYLILGSSIMTLTTTPTQLTDGIEKGLRFLSYIKIPVHEFAMMMSIALRFIPILSEEMQKIKKAQMARGADFESGNLLKRAKAMIPLLVPLFISAFSKAGELAIAMDSRCYNGANNRTKLKPLSYNVVDYIAYLFFAGFTAMMIMLRIFIK